MILSLETFVFLLLGAIQANALSIASPSSSPYQNSLVDLRKRSPVVGESSRRASKGFVLLEEANEQASQHEAWVSQLEDGDAVRTNVDLLRSESAKRKDRKAALRLTVAWNDVSSLMNVPGFKQTELPTQDLGEMSLRSLRMMEDVASKMEIKFDNIDLQDETMILYRKHYNGMVMLLREQLADFIVYDREHPVIGTGFKSEQWNYWKELAGHAAEALSIMRLRYQQLAAVAHFTQRH